MIKKRAAGNERRARNIIWNAAGHYDIEPAFMAYFPDGAPDYYFDMVIGLVYKWLDAGRLEEFFESYSSDRRSDEFDAFLWLGLGNCVYEKELSERPVIQGMRKDRAGLFFKKQQTLSRQQMMYQSMPVYTQQEIRWSGVLGRRMPIMSAREKRMSEDLMFSGGLDTDGVTEAMERFLFDHFKVSSDKGMKKKEGLHFVNRILRHEHRRKDSLLVRTGSGKGNHPKAVSLKHTGLGRFTGIKEEDTLYIREIFGECRISERELALIENEACTGGNELCRLWIAESGGNTEGEGQSREAAEIRKSRALQRKRNEKYAEERAALIRSSVRILSAHIDTVLSSYLKHLPEKAKAGRIRPEIAYRIPLVRDTAVFLKDGDETESELEADILLDASQSRMHSQEVLSSEAYIIAKSLTAAGIPVRVRTFRSIRGYTVIETLKDKDDRDCRGIFSYYTGGWNRDSVAIRAAGAMGGNVLYGQDTGNRRMLLVLTDANPNDSAPFLTGDGLINMEYEGAAAVKDTADAVKELRERDMRVGAVFFGNPAHLGNVQQIYGNEYVQIRRNEQLAQGVGDLLLKMLE